MQIISIIDNDDTCTLELELTAEEIHILTERAITNLICGGENGKDTQG